jgi:hypothetical protein
MVLFAPKMIEKFRAQGAEEGLRQGVEIGVEIGVKQEREKWQAWQQRVDAWYQRLQDAQANGVEQGVKQGAKQERERWQAWYRRSQEAQADGQPFNEPPPAPDGNHESPQ